MSSTVIFDNQPSGHSTPPEVPGGRSRPGTAGTVTLLWLTVAGLALLGTGLFLGLLDLVSMNSPGVLRVPALIAALLLTSEGMIRLESAWSRPAEVVLPPDPDGAAVTTAPGRALPAPAPAKADGAEKKRSPEETSAYLLLGLSVWLGLAALTVPVDTTSMSLRLLAMLGTVLLFKHGWSLIAPKPN